ncbi:hypothetical protein ACWC3X_42490 [Streptomyces populi]
MLSMSPAFEFVAADQREANGRLGEAVEADHQGQVCSALGTRGPIEGVDLSEERVE